RFGEEISDRLGDHRADALDQGELFRCVFRPRGGPQRRPVPEMAREAEGVGLADVANAERIEEAVKRDRATRVNGAEEVTRRSLAEPLPFAERRTSLPVARLKGEDIGGGSDQVLSEEKLDQLFPQPLDVEGVARDEVFEALDGLRRADQRAGAAAHDV